MFAECKMQAVESILKIYGECPWLDPSSNSCEGEEDEIVSMNSVESILKMDGEWPWLNPSPNSCKEEEDEIVSVIEFNRYNSTRHRMRREHSDFTPKRV